MFKRNKKKVNKEIVNKKYRFTLLNLLTQEIEVVEAYSVRGAVMSGCYDVINKEEL